MFLRLHWRLSTISKISKKVYEVMWYVKVFMFWKWNQNTLRWDKMHMLKKFPSDTINGTKNALFLLLRAPTHHSFACNLRFLYELKHKVRLPKTMSRIFYFQFLFVFIEVHIFVQQNTSTLSLWSVVIPFKKIKKKSRSFVPRPPIFKLQQEVLKFNIWVSWIFKT